MYLPLAPVGAAHRGSRPARPCRTKKWRNAEWSPYQLRHLDELDVERGGADQSRR